MTNKKESKSENKYSSFSVEELNQEFFKIIALPEARTNIAAINEMSDLMSEYKRRKVDMPSVIPHSYKRSRPRPQIQPKPKLEQKPWWKFW